MPRLLPVLVTHNVCADTEWLFAKNMFIHFNSLEGLVCVCSDDSSNNNSLETSMLQEPIVVCVDGRTVWLELLVAPFCFMVVESPSGDHVCSKCTLKEVGGMSTAHAT